MSFDFREYAAHTLYHAIDHLINQCHPPELSPSNGVVVEELNKICLELAIPPGDLSFELDGDGETPLIGVHTDEGARRLWDLIYVFAAHYPSLLRY